MSAKIPRKYVIPAAIIAFVALAGIGSVAAANGMGMLRLHWCGNGKIEARETCDDGNRKSGDGCTNRCQKEKGYRSSSSSSVAMSTTCMSSEQCGRGYYCTTEDGDCRSACPPGADMCTQVCAGVCKSTVCKPYICPDGTRHPSCSEDGHVINYFADPCLTHQASSSSSSREAASCDTQKGRYNVAVNSNKACKTDSDCALFEASCPFVTCGEAINKSALDTARAAANAYVKCQQEAGGPIACAACIMQTVSCVSGRCTAR